MARGWNVFAIGRRSHDEDQLTEMLAWLVARVPQVGHALIRLAFDDDFGVVEFTCTTQSGIEGGRLDALFTGSDFALVIESKIESDFGADQIERYLDWLEVVHGRRARRGLLTLTKRPLSTERLAELTARDGVAGSAHLWEELHERLGDLPEVDELQRVLVDEFLEMLEQEGLIPVKPFDPENELTSWHGASRTVDRFHTFFDACKPEIAEKLDASPVPNKKSAGPGHIWQEFQFSDGARLTVGLDCSSEGHPGRGGAVDAPVLWMQLANSSRSDWPELASAMDKRPPAGWSSTERWEHHPWIWRPLHETIGTGSFDEQRLRLADACAVARSWIADARKATENA
jgi:hypothetical protein